MLSFTDCATNKLLKDKLFPILNKDVHTIPIDFKPRFRGGFSQIADKEYVLSSIEKIVKQGGILIGGGSWQDSPTEISYRDKIILPLLKEVARPGSRLRLFNICFSAQVFADAMGKKYYKSELKTVPGLLEIGPTPIELTKKGQSHPWFKNFPKQATFSTTHSGHIIDKFPGKQRQLLPSEIQVIPLIKSSITKLPLAWSTFNNHVFSTIIHPEIDLIGEDAKISKDIFLIQSQIESAAESIKAMYDIDPAKVIFQNWQQIIDQNGNPRIVANGGQALLIGGLLQLAKSIPRDEP